jgi:exodeoxyribonuclease VII large subunit
MFDESVDNFQPTMDRAAFRPQVIGVARLLRVVRTTLEQTFSLLWVSGEISNFSRAASGHWYFTLKDERAQVRCVMFRNRNQYLDWLPNDGLAVEVYAAVTLYEQRGDFQLTIEAIRRAGLGALYEAFERLKVRLGKEGLFDTARKKPLPAFPRQIGIITSPAAAALRDVLTVLQRRSPWIPLVIYPTPVQGEGAAHRIAVAIACAAQRAECDALILCRGGGGIEDLWPFNEEIVARAIAACPIPIVSGVGHETDFTIGDFVADRRAPTPTAAAELLSPNREDLRQRLMGLRTRLSKIQRRGLEAGMLHLDYLARALVHPGERLRRETTHLAQIHIRLRNAWLHFGSARLWHLERARMAMRGVRPDVARHLANQRQQRGRLQRALERCLEEAATRLAGLQANLAHLNPQAILERGFAVVRLLPAAEIVRSSRGLAPGDKLEVTFAEGSAQANVLERSP